MKIISHKWYKARSLPYMICGGCGLVRLRNNITEKAIRYGCDHDEHPDYKRFLNKLRGIL